MGETISPYLVLARKYRPLNFAELIGQDAMVQTFANAFKSNRIHHAFMLTGVRGVGKTTTARILARAFNYVDESDATPNIELKKQGEHCQAIIEGRHVDVIEMDAASNTGIDDIREIIDSIKYGPVSAPYKVYIIDEVHMLSKQAFNGLLKTLEEPPEYVKFIFATTEIRKVPITILSRCQRFDLQRITSNVMINYLNEILEKEKISAEPDALSMIVRAGDGSVRDCLSLLDQAIAHGDGKLEAKNINAMLGLADRSIIIDLFELLFSGKIADALELFEKLYNSGAGPQIIISELADLVHLCTRSKIIPASIDDISLTPDEKKRIPDIANKLNMRLLTRSWQILSKGLDEVKNANNDKQSGDMVLIKLAYASDLPNPDELIEKIEEQQKNQLINKTHISSNQNNISHSSPTNIRSGLALSQPNFSAQSQSMSAQLDISPKTNQLAMPTSFTELVILAGEKRDLAVKHALENDLKPVSFEKGRIEVALVEGANSTIIATLAARLKSWTNQTWLVTISSKENSQPTIREINEAKKLANFEIAKKDELIMAIFETFPNSKLINVKITDKNKG